MKEPSPRKSSVQLQLEESEKQRDARVEQLWRQLDYQHKGELDWRGLQRGLHKIDHPLKNADSLLKAITKVVDTNGDGKIQYQEFKTFVDAAETQLFQLFKTIDKDENGHLDKAELEIALNRAGLSVPARRLNAFFEEIDKNRDGYISFDEWRNFLLFMPNHASGATLRAAWAFYSEMVTLNSEGDSVVNDNTVRGLGTAIQSFLRTHLGLLFQINLSPKHPMNQGDAPGQETRPRSSPAQQASHEKIKEGRTVTHTATVETDESAGGMKSQLRSHDMAILNQSTATNTTSESPIHDGLSKSEQSKGKKKLMKYMPDPGYFIAGALAGGISRTATAPLDRLKVYLLVDTNPITNVAVEAAKKGRLAQALRGFGQPLVSAVSHLYKTGGIRGFFAGNGLNVIKIMPETSIRFGAYEMLKTGLAKYEGHDEPHSVGIKPAHKFLAGGTAGMIAQFCVYPLDTVKFRLQSEYVSAGPRGNALLKEVIMKMWAEGGVRAAYRGVTMGLIGMFPYSAIDMGTFEILKTNYVAFHAKRLGCHEEDAHPSTLMTGVMGATSGAFGATAVYPLNVLRTRLQTQGTKMHPAHYTGIMDVFRKTVRNEGARGLYKGLMPNLLKVAPALSITWMVYEKTKSALDLR